jgi:hypothetical protein
MELLESSIFEWTGSFERHWSDWGPRSLRRHLLEED